MRIAEEDNIALRCPCLHLVKEHRPIGAFGATVNIQYRRVFFLRIIIFRQKNPPINFFAVQFRHNRLWLGYVQIFLCCQIPGCQSMQAVLYHAVHLRQHGIQHSHKNGSSMIHIVITDKPACGNKCIDLSIQSNPFHFTSISVQRWEVEILLIRLRKSGSTIFHIRQHRVSHTLICFVQ